MSIVEFEYANQIVPLKNTTAMKSQANLLVSHASTTVDLTTLFGKLENGHFLTFEADGAKVYIALGTLAGTISELATGNGNTVCWPIADGQTLSVNLTGGREVATGIATMVHYRVLHYMSAATGATGYLRIYRSSLGPTQGSEQFPAP